MNIIDINILNTYLDKGLLRKQSHPTYPLLVWNYTELVQYEPNLWDEITTIARGLITDINGNIIATPFKKFWNIEENKHIPSSEFFIEEKMDGCCHEDIILLTENGKKTIKEICETKYNGKILSFDVLLNKIKYEDIIHHSILQNNNDWYEIELEDGKKIKLTGNHKIFITELNCWRRVEELKGDETLLLIKN